MLSRIRYVSVRDEEFAAWTIRLGGGLEALRSGDLDRIMSVLRAAANDNDIFPVRLAAGSVIIVLVGRHSAFARLRTLAKSGVLSRLVGRDVLDTHELPRTWLRADNWHAAHTLNLTSEFPSTPASGAGGKPVLFIGIREHHPDNKPFHFQVAFTEQHSKGFLDEAAASLHYFLEGLSVPPHDIRVTLAPYQPCVSPSRSADLELTRVMLTDDLEFKRLTTSHLCPCGEIGRAFWDELSRALPRREATTLADFEPHFRLCIEPDRIGMLEASDGCSAVVTEAKLKVVGEEVHLAARGRESGRRATRPPTRSDEVAWRVFEKTVLPELCREVNEGTRLARSRQAYQSLILAAWFRAQYKNDVRYCDYFDRQVEPEEVRFTLAWTDRVIPYAPKHWRRTGDATHRPRAELVREANAQTFLEYQRLFHEGVCCCVRHESLDAQGLPVRLYVSGAMRWTDGGLDQNRDTHHEGGSIDNWDHAATEHSPDRVRNLDSMDDQSLFAR